MFVVGNLIYAVATILNYILQIATWLVIIRALLSWVSPDPFNPIVRFLNSVTEPILMPFRKIIPVHNFGIDISPVLAILFLWFLRMFLVRTLIDLAARLS